MTYSAYTNFPSPVPLGLVEAISAAGIACYWEAGTFYVSDLIAAQNIVASYSPLVAEAEAMLAGGFQITSATDSTLNGTYGCALQDQVNVQAQINSILLNGTFTNGQSTIPWRDASGASHTFDVTHFKALATQMGIFVTTLANIISDQAGTLPTQPAAIG